MSAADLERVRCLKKALAAVRTARSVVQKTYDPSSRLCRQENILVEQLEVLVKARFKEAREQLNAHEMKARAHGAGGGHS